MITCQSTKTMIIKSRNGTALTGFQNLTGLTFMDMILRNYLKAPLKRKILMNMIKI